MEFCSQGKLRRLAKAGFLACGVLLMAGPWSGLASNKHFLKHCASCHGKDGRARTPVARKLGVKDLSLSKATDAEIETRIREGRKDERGVQKMPAFQEKLSAEEIESLVSLVKEFRN